MRTLTWRPVLAAGVVALLVGAQAPSYAARSRVLFHFQDPSITESSALVDGGDDVVFTVNDSGDGARVFVVEKSTGRTVGVTTYSAHDPVDVEALAAGPGGVLWVADIGDNSAQRSRVTLYRIPTPARGDHTVVPTTFDLVYSDGPRDAETLLVHPRTGRLYVVSKGLLGGTVYAAPGDLRADRTNVLQPVAGAPGLVTDGVYLPDGRHVLLRDYSDAILLRGERFAGVTRFGLPAQRQGEGIGTDGATVLTSSEGQGAEVWRTAIPARVLRLIGPGPVVASPSPSPVSPSPVPPSPVPRVDVDAPENAPSRLVPVALAAAWVVLLTVLVARFVRRRR